MSRRDQIRMTDAELAAFLDEQRTLILATVGRDGWPHLMPLWYTVRAGEPWAWTYARSQKVRNLERDPRATWQVEAGESYEQLRGVMVKARVELVRDVSAVEAFGRELFRRYTGLDPLPDPVLAMIGAQAPKRVVLRMAAAEPPVTWDHAKLGGTY